MKSLRSILLMGAAALLVSACNNDEEPITSAAITDGTLTPVQFDMDVSALKMGIANRALSPVYTSGGFTIYAFKQDGDNFLCNQVIDGSTMSYNGQSQKLTGKASLPIGTYKFLPVYGIAGAPSGTIPANMIGQALTDDLLINQVEAGLLPEIFLMDGPAANLTTYDMGLTSEQNQTVTATLKRAVARVDVMFISARKGENGEYIEQPMVEGKNVLGNGLRRMDLNFTTLNRSMNIFGIKKGATIAGEVPYTVPGLANRITIGDGTSTSVGEPSYVNFDKVVPGDLITGGAHIGGLYLIPNSDETKTVALNLDVYNTANEKRNITINELLPLVRNKVTLVKVYAISGGGDNTIFDTNVTFEVIIETAWLGSNVVVGETD